MVQKGRDRLNPVGGMEAGSCQATYKHNYDARSRKIELGNFKHFTEKRELKVVRKKDLRS